MISDLIKSAAQKYSLDSCFLNALISTESGFNTLAIRYEPDYKYVYKVSEMAKLVGCTVDTMLTAQKTSWGLCQVMGSNYYELGGKNWPTILLDPKVNIDFTGLFLSKLIKSQRPSGPKELYASFNAGSVRYMSNGNLVNQANVDRFMKAYMQVKTI